MKIEEVHANNFKRMKELGFKPGDRLRHKTLKYCVTISHIHKIYGWLCDAQDSTVLKQDWSNAHEFEVIN